MKRSKSSSDGSKPSSLKWFAFIFMGVVVSLILLGGVALVAFYVQVDRSLPSAKALKNYHPPIVSTMYAGDGSVIGEFFTERRYLVPLQDMPPHLIKAFLAAEDARFYEHRGIDPVSVIRAMFKNVQAGEIVQGGSTITQQVIKSLLLTPERTWIRKVKEAILAYRIDHSLTKDEILYLYLNQVYLGAGAYGVESGARTYFNKHVDELTVSESAILAGLVKAPSRFSPYLNYSSARERQRYTLDRMAEEGFITSEEARSAYEEPVQLAKSRYEDMKTLNFYTEEVRRQVEAKYGRDGLYKEGLSIYTTLNQNAQKLAEAALDKGLRELDKRHGYRGPHRHVPQDQWPEFVKNLREDNHEAGQGAVVEALVVGYDKKAKKYDIDLGGTGGQLSTGEAKWAQGYFSRGSKGFKPGDVIWVSLGQQENERWTTRLEQEPEVQGSIMSMAPDTGKVLCMVGGRNFKESQFNRATQAVRQPGSSFKPIVFAAALDKGYTQASILIDAPFSRPGSGLQEYWQPSNYDNEFWGPIQLRTALVHSRNVVTVKLLNDIGVNYAIDYARRLGIQSALTPTLALALGASGVTLSEMMTAYSTFANHGERSNPYLIEKITDRHGNVLEERQEQHESVISAQTAYLITNLLQAAVEEGTGKFAKRLNRPAAGKTGTTNDLKDAWFMGYTPSLLTGVWVGYDDNRRSLGHKETGGHAACPIWTYFNETWLKDQPVESFPIPSGIIFVKTGFSTASPEGSHDGGAYLAFAEDRLPTQRIASHDGLEASEAGAEASGNVPSSGSSSSFFKSDLF